MKQLFFIFIFFLISTPIWSADPTKELPESEDFSGTPYSEYAEFDSADDEAQDTLFFQHGRFFGVSIGSGLHQASGNRGILWQGGFPMIAFNFHYWFDFNWALHFGFYTVKHNFFFDEINEVPGSVGLTHLGFAIRYYFPTQNLSAAISFSNPYLSLGGGNYRKETKIESLSVSDIDDVFAVNLGAGLEFPIEYKKVYFVLDGRLHFPTFADKYSTEFRQTKGLSDLTGFLYSLSGHLLFTW